MKTRILSAWSLALLLVAVSGGVAEGRAVTTSPTDAARPSGFRGTGSLGIGLGYLGLSNARTDGSDDNEFGLALEARVGYRFGRFIGFNVSAAWGLSHFERTKAVAEAGIKAGKWTNGAFSSVTDWMGKDGHEGYAAFGWMAYPILAMTYLAVPVLFAVSPLAATSFFNGGFTVSGHLGGDTIDAFLEGGIGGLIYLHPIENTPLAGYGPLFGAGMRLGRFGVNARLLWSPAGTQTQVDDIHTDVYTLTVTGGLAW